MFTLKQEEILAIHLGQGLAIVEMFGKFPRSPSPPVPVLMYVFSFDLFVMKCFYFSSVTTHQEAQKVSLITQCAKFKDRMKIIGILRELDNISAF